MYLYLLPKVRKAFSSLSPYSSLTFQLSIESGCGAVERKPSRGGTPRPAKVNPRPAGGGGG